MAEVYLDKVPDDGVVWGMYGACLGSMGCFADARTALHTARGLVASDENKVFVYRLIAELDEALGDYRSAEALYREAARLLPTQGCWQLWLGVCLRRQGRDPEAEACYRKALTLDGDRDEYLLNLGFILQARGALADAAACFSEALAIDPNYEPAKNSLADVRRAIAFLQGSPDSLEQSAADQSVEADEA